MKLTRYNDISFLKPEAIKKIQEARLGEHIAYCKNNSPFYRDTLKALKIENGPFGLEGLSVLPFTEKGDIEKRNDDFCAVERSKIVDIVLSSGTTGRPIRMMYSDYDLKRLAYNEEKSFRGCGVTEDDVVLLTCTMDRCFVAGLAYFLGIRNIGASAIRNGHGSLESHAEIIAKMQPTVIVGVPTFLKKLGLYLRDKHINGKKTSVSKLACIGEPLRDKDLKLLRIGEDLQRIWQAKAFSTYASSEIVTTFCECMAQQGGHLHPDLAIVEIIDESGRILGSGEIGEVVVTPLAVEGMPLIRFKTGDISFLIDKQCPCGRCSPRLGPILGRKKQMMKLRGTTVYPQTIYSALEEIDIIKGYYIVVTNESDLSDNVTVYASVKDKSYTAAMIEDWLQSRLRVKPAVVITDEKNVRKQVYTQESRKPVQFVDKR